MKLAVIGSRRFHDIACLRHAVDLLAPSTIISGGASGADTLAAQYAKERGLPLIEILPDLARYGSPAAYHIRNRTIVAECDAVIAFVKGPSRGTQSTIREARKQGKRITVIAAD